MHRFSGQSGLTLVELLVAMAVSLILLSGIYQVFLGSTATYKSQDSLSRLQENGRCVMEALAQKVRLAGYPRVSMGGTNFAGDPVSGVEGASGASDSLTVNFSSAAGAGLDPPYTFAVDNTDVELEMTDNSSTQPLIEGVENMQILYGEDTDGDSTVDVYRTATDVTAWPQVVAVRIGLLLRTIDEIPDADLDTATYNVNGTVIDPVDDRRLRRVFTTTISLRNRMQ